MSHCDARAGLSVWPRAEATSRNTNQTLPPCLAKGGDTAETGKSVVPCRKSTVMTIAIAGPYSAPTETQRQKNLDAMNQAAARVYQKGHIPFIGVNMALPVVAMSDVADIYAAIMDISMAVIDKCDAILMIGESNGANREKEHIASKGLPVYYSLDEIPALINQ